MSDRKVPTYAEIASFKASLIKAKKTLGQDELKLLQEKLVVMEFTCLRAISSLTHRSDKDLMARARKRARLEHVQYSPEGRSRPPSRAWGVAPQSACGDSFGDRVAPGVRRQAEP